MTPVEKRRFINELINNVRKDIFARIRDMPEEWDGHELRRYIADKFDQSAMTVGKGRKDYAARFREYKNAVLVRNL